MNETMEAAKSVASEQTYISVQQPSLKLNLVLADGSRKQVVFARKALTLSGALAEAMDRAIADPENPVSQMVARIDKTRAAAIVAQHQAVQAAVRGPMHSGVLAQQKAAIMQAQALAEDPAAEAEVVDANRLYTEMQATNASALEDAAPVAPSKAGKLKLK